MLVSDDVFTGLNRLQSVGTHILSTSSILMLTYADLIGRMHKEVQSLILIEILARNKHDVEKPETDQEAFFLDLLTLRFAYDQDVERTAKIAIPDTAVTLTEWNLAYKRLLAKVEVAMSPEKKAKAKSDGADSGMSTLNNKRGNLYKNKMIMQFLTKAFCLHSHFRRSVLFKTTILSEKINGTLGGVSRS